MVSLSEGRKLLAYYIAQPVAGLLAKTPITPDILTWFGFLVAVGAAGLIVTGHLFAAGWVVLIAGFSDMLDGALARRINRTTRFGAFLDSTLDRLSEAVLLLGILVLNLYFKSQLNIEVLLVCLALIGSFLVSYVRARAEALGIECQLGVFTRAERVIVLALGLLLNQIDYALIAALAIIVLFSFITTGQRVLYVWQQTKIK